MIRKSQTVRRTRSEMAQSRRLVLAPGFGVAADDWRVRYDRRLVHQQTNAPKRGEFFETIVLRRRIAGGFTPDNNGHCFKIVGRGYEARLAAEHRRQLPGTNLTTELLRLVGPWNGYATKTSLRPRNSACSPNQEEIWSRCMEHSCGRSGRLGSPRACVCKPATGPQRFSRVESYLERLMRWDDSSVKKNASMVSLCMMLLARRTDDRLSRTSPAVCGNAWSIFCNPIPHPRCTWN